MNPRLPAILFLVVLISSCSSTYDIEGSYPKPLVAPIPVQLELEFDDAFKNYAYKEEDENRNEVTVNLGNAQVELFETVTTAMFSGTEGSPILRIKPAVNGFQYAIPRETRAEIYEVWLKYRVTVEETDGVTIADWVVTGYGKTPSAFMKSQGEAINAATIIALRDIGTQLAIGFRRQPDIGMWIANNLGAQEP